MSSFLCRSIGFEKLRPEKNHVFLRGAISCQCEFSINGAAAENDFLLSKKAPASLDQEAVLFISLMSGSVRTTTSTRRVFVRLGAGPRLVTPAPHYSARVTSRAPPGKVKPPPLTRTQTKTHSVSLLHHSPCCCWRD